MSALWENKFSGKVYGCRGRSGDLCAMKEAGGEEGGRSCSAKREMKAQSAAVGTCPRSPLGPQDI